MKLPHGKTPITPMLTVKDIDAALAFYQKAFGFTTGYSMPGPDGKTVHAEMSHEGQALMLGCECPQSGSTSPSSPGQSFALYLYVEDVDKFQAHAAANGATVKQPATDMFWGDRTCGMIDPFGHHWSFATFVKDVKAEDLKSAMAAQFAGSRA